MSGEQAITLFDLRSTLTPQAWSLHACRTRFVLNYKKLPYTTKWVAFPDIGETLSAVGAPPTRADDPKYSVPAIIDAIADPPVVLSDSTVIADYLEKTYPEPSIYPHGREAQMKWLDAIMDDVIMRMAFMVIPTTPRYCRKLMRSIYQHEEVDLRYARLYQRIVQPTADSVTFEGLDVKDMIATSPKEEAERWQALEEGLGRLSALTDEIEHGDKWLFGTSKGPGYADFVLATTLNWFRWVGPEGGWERIRNTNGGKWARHLDHVKEYMEVL
ncbi:uncharacterized protein B0H18DRAFT_1123656 [Fomitopsis serialis]|uniref:uncharacterized protein n=1 Tax=Fomitopsis serialis TaxID=139415 RepID=UPI002007DD58|nr:uncharacterized protein B0H18DRAFT_1123656 [Neoantrodia serialis]KAH9917306.1 hypothetical protein B0H18DRAFT_1123656 [Neoantrodia serialis]